MEAKYIVVLCFSLLPLVGMLIAVATGVFAARQKQHNIDKWNKQDYTIRVNTTYKGYDIVLWVYNVYGHDYDLESFHDSKKSRRIYGLITKTVVWPSFHIIRYREKWQFYDDALNETLTFAKTMIDDGAIDQWFDTTIHLDDERALEFLRKQNREEFKMTSNRPKIF